MNITFSQYSTWADESPKPVVEGATLNIAATFWGAPTVVSAAVYRNRTLATSTCMPAGSVSISGNTATLKPLTAMLGGNRYVVAVTATVGGEVHIKKMMLICAKDESEQ